jgi:hypothetical protein
MLTTFTPPLTFRLAICLARAFRHRSARRLALALVLPAVCVIAMGWLVISQPAQHGCPPAMRASSAVEMRDYCDRAGGSKFRSASRATVSAPRPGARMAAVPAALRRLSLGTPP